MTQNVPRGTMTIGNALRTALGIFSGKMIFICELGKSADFPSSLFSQMGLQRETGGFCIHGLALSVTFGDSSPKGRASGETPGFAF